MYQLALLTQKQHPSWADMKPILQQADDANDRTRDVRPLMAVLTRIIEANPRLRGHMLTRRTAIASFSWSIRPHDPADEESAQKAALRIAAVVKEVMWHQVMAVAFDAFCLQIKWAITPLGQTPIPVKRFKPVELEKLNDYRLSILEDAPALKRVLELSTMEPTSEYIVDLSDDDSRGGFLRSVLGHEIMQADMMREWANYNRKLKGILQGTYELGSADDEIKAARAAMESAIKDNFLVTSEAIQFKLNEIVKGSGASFKEHIDQLQRDVCIGILGQANASELPRTGGSRAALQVLQLIRADIHYADQIRTENIINEQVLRHDFRLNHDITGTQQVPWRFTIDAIEETNLIQVRESVADLYRSGIPLNAEEAYRNIGFTKPSSVLDELVRPPDPNSSF